MPCSKVEHRKGPAPPFVPGVLVQVNRLTSPKGRPLNEKYGIVRSTPTAKGVIARYEGDYPLIEDCKPLVSVKSFNLNCIDPNSENRLGYQFLERYLHNKAVDILQKEGTGKRWFDVWIELFDIPGVAPLPMRRADMAVVLRCLGRFEEAVAMAEACLSEMLHVSPMRWKAKFELGTNLTNVHRLGEAMDMAAVIQAEAGHTETAKWMACGLLRKIAGQCDREGKRAPVKERALRACLNLRPDHAATMKDLGSTLCKMNMIDEGKLFMERSKDGNISDPIPIDMEKARGDGIHIERVGIFPDWNR